MKDSKRDILDFWFHEAKPAQWFQRNDVFDDLIRTRFGADYDLAAKGIFDGWMDDAEGALALVILLDQFPRNMFRDDPRAFATDAKARSVTRHALDKHFDLMLGVDQRAFLYLPYEHSEDLLDQDQSVALFARIKDKNPVYFDYALRHRDEIVRFGRFPRRNAALGRENTPEEVAFLAEQSAV